MKDFRKSVIRLPATVFLRLVARLPAHGRMVFCNGLADRPEERVMNLSGAFAGAVRMKQATGGSSFVLIGSGKRTALFPFVHKL